MVMLRIVTTVTAAGALGKICSTLGVAARETSPFRSSDYHSREHQLGSNDIRTQVTPSVPLVVNTWTEDFASATKQAWSVISSAIETEGTSALLDAVEAVCSSDRQIAPSGRTETVVLLWDWLLTLIQREKLTVSLFRTTADSNRRTSCGSTATLECQSNYMNANATMAYERRLHAVRWFLFVLLAACCLYCPDPTRIRKSGAY